VGEREIVNMMTKTALYVLIMVFSIPFPNLVLAWSGKVVGISDGDTITVLLDRQQVKVRLYGIDTPEKKQDFGTKAKWFLSGLVFKKTVEIESIDTDRYGRTVGIVYLGGKNINEEIVRSGFAWVYQRYCTRSICGAWKRLEASARAGKVGLWAQGQPGAALGFQAGWGIDKQARI